MTDARSKKVRAGDFSGFAPVAHPGAAPPTSFLVRMPVRRALPENEQMHVTLHIFFVPCLEVISRAYM